MPGFQKNKKNNVTTFFCLFMIALFIGGCAAQKPMPAETDTGAAGEKPEAAAADVMDETAETGNTGGIVRSVNSVQLDVEDQVLKVKIQGNEKLVYTSIKQSFPFGIAVYMPETKIAQGLVVPEVNHPAVTDLIVSYADMEQTTAKVEILLSEDLNYEVDEKSDTLEIVLSGFDAGAAAVAEASAAEKPGPVTQDPVSPAVDVPPGVATLTNIEFKTMEDGKSDIIVHTNQPINYKITHGANGLIYLNLYDTKIPYYHQRALLTHYFKSAVEQLTPVELPGKEKNSRIEIQTRDTVPFRVMQDEKTISMFFEPSRIDPPVFTKSKKHVISGEQVELADGEPAPAGRPMDSPAETQEHEAAEALSVEEQFFGPKPKYTGEKIKLDFFETDIKNVIRILRSVGGLNFAVDKDVQGKVTLTLEEPVPWDQVLDLVLRMNNLGKKQEGNVVRIATLATLKEEERQIQEAIAAKRMTLEQQKSLEPLVTEYIPINYSDATADIQPHLEKILTKDRGKISVDKRTNMIILTDTQAKIEQAKELIFRLDKVTPQIMIEAKVVEVTKEFSRELGLGLSLTKSQTEWTGREKDFTIALNHPVSAPVNTGSFNFYKILGSNFLNLNAQIAASEQKGDVKVVSSPRILTLDNKKAKIKQGIEYAYLERDSSGGSSVKFKNIDLLLEVTPHVTPDSRISMTVYLTKNDIDSITDGVPSLSTNEAETELLVNDTDTIVIGGIVKTTENEGSNGTPVLQDIPVLGRLFRVDAIEDARKELLIFLTPSIVQLEQKKNTFTSQN